MNRTDFRKRLFCLLLGAFAGAVLLAVFYLLGTRGIGIPCIFYAVTGLECPGCGNSRAALSLLRLDFAAALRYNLLFPLEFGYILWMLLRCSLSYLRDGAFRYRPKNMLPDLIVLIAVLLWGIIRNLI